jgi:hypothetical protein
MRSITKKPGRPSLDGAKRLRLSITLKPDLAAKIAKRASESGLSVSRFAEQLLEDGLRADRRRRSLWEARLGVDAEQVAALCRALGVSRLCLFGSSLTDRFRPDSDVDLLVEYKPGAAETLLAMGHVQMQFERFFGRRVDLAELALVDNPIRRQEIEAHHQEIYAA